MLIILPPPVGEAGDLVSSGLYIRPCVWQLCSDEIRAVQAVS